MGVLALEDKVKVDRLIRISQRKPLDHNTFVPWENDIRSEEYYLPEHLISLSGHPLWDTLTVHQKCELGRMEVIQLLYSYAWSEGMACLFFNKELVKLDVTDVEYRFLLREIIEEMQHQEMFSRAVDMCKGTPIKPGRLHKWLGNLSVQHTSPGMSFMSVIAVELLADVYAREMRKDPKVFPILSKVSELHEIEEGRHIYYAKLWLKHFTDNAGFFRRTLYSFNVCLSVWFMRNLYVQKSFFEEIGVSDPNKYFKAAKQQLKEKYQSVCLDETIEFVESFNGFNFITRPIWRWFHNLKF